jgi:hypothetical protein
MTEPARLSDRELFAARPWRAADRTQVIVAVAEASGSWQVVLATLEGRPVYSKPLEGRRTPGSFTEPELQALYEEARSSAV